MEKSLENTENKILDAAKQEFIEKGLSGARMQSIADRAGISKSLLHYYYRSKYQLFEFIFKNVIKTMIPDLIRIFENAEMDFYAKLKVFINMYVSALNRNSQIPVFILHEINTNPKGLIDFLKSLSLNTSNIIENIKEEMRKGNIKETNPYHLLINVISLCVFPIAAKPIFQTILVNEDKNEIDRILSERKEHIYNFIVSAIKP